MKLSELGKQQGALVKIEALSDERSALALLLHDIDEGESASVETSSSYEQTLGPASMPLVRQAIEQSLAIVEGELLGLGVELDVPAWMPDEAETSANDDAEG